MFKSLKRELFEVFHHEFQGDTWDICGRCGGKCEINKIGSFMPGEAEFIASRTGHDIEEFRNLYLDGVVTPFGTVEVLKFKPGCSFLNEAYECSIKKFKLVLCETYPIVFEVVDGRVDFSLDSWCPIVRHEPDLSVHFKEKGIAAIERIGAPVDWYRAVAMYDELCVDYHKLFALRDSNLGFKLFTLEQIMSCQDDDAPPPELSRQFEIPT